MYPKALRIRGSPACVLGMAFLFAALAAECISENAVTVDEFAHVPAGVSQWERGAFYLYREDPPFIRSLVALPVWLAGVQTDYSQERVGPGIRSEGDVARSFMYANASRYLALFVRARLVVVAFALACGGLIFLWGKQLFGAPAAAICAAFWFSDPNVLANSSIATLDVGTAAIGFFASFLFWRLLGTPTWRNAFLAGLGLGLAQASKFTMLALYPAWVVMALLHHRPVSQVEPSSRRRWVKIGAAFVVSLLVLNACYGFEGSFRKLGSYQFFSHFLGSREVLVYKPSSLADNRFRSTILADCPLPLPENYMQGFDSKKWHEEIGLARMDHGKVVQGGTYLTPFRTLAYKMPLGALILLVTAVVRWFARPGELTDHELVIMVLPFFLMALLCSQTGLNWAFRYLLPALPFLFLAVGGLIKTVWGDPLGKAFVVGCLLWNGLELVIVRPHYLSYGNEIAGGPAGAASQFLGSNYDWGQDLVRLKHWCDAHPYAQPLRLAYYGPMSPEIVGLATRPLPARLARPRDERLAVSEEHPEPLNPYYCAVSISYLNGFGGPMNLEGVGLIPSFFQLPPHYRPHDATCPDRVHDPRLSRRPVWKRASPR